MTPTLVGRWQTRLFLFATIGVLVTALFAFLYNDGQTPFVILGYVFIFGLGWDLLYQFLQSFRWDRDWPPGLIFAAGVWEGIFIFSLIRLIGLPGISAALTSGQFWAHYGTVFIMIFICSFSLLHILFPHWRLHGGQWLRGRYKE